MNNCPNCGSNVNPGEAFCRMCGTKIPTPENNITNNTQQPQTDFSNNAFQPINNNVNSTFQPQTTFNQNNTMVQNSYNNDDALIDAYIGKNVDKLKNGGFSGCTFFFGAIYALYRKMWLLGAIWIAAAMIANLFLPTFASLLSLVANIVISIQFKKWYMKHVEEEVAKIKAQNPGKSNKELIEICRKKGGTSMIPVIIAIIFYAAIVAYTTAQTVKTIQEAKEKAGNIDYNYDNTNTNTTTDNSDLDITIPSMLAANTIGSGNYVMYNSEDYKCYIAVTTSQYAKLYNYDAKTYMEKKIYYSATDTFSGFSTKTINGKTWQYAKVTKSYGESEHYGIVNGENAYAVEFSATNEAKSKCQSAFNSAVNSMRIK